MSDGAIDAVLEGIEIQLDRSGKNVSRGLLAALTGGALAWTLPFLNVESMPSRVSVPWLGFALPGPIASVVFVLASTALGGFGAFHLWKAMALGRALGNVQAERSLDDREIPNALAARLARARDIVISPFILGLAVLVATTLHEIAWGMLSKSCFGSGIIYGIVLGFITSSPYAIAWLIVITGGNFRNL